MANLARSRLSGGLLQCAPPLSADKAEPMRPSGRHRGALAPEDRGEAPRLPAGRRASAPVKRQARQLAISFCNRSYAGFGRKSRVRNPPLGM